VGRGIRTSALCCAVLAVAAVGCGSSKKKSDTTSSSGGVVQQPKPTQPISAVVPLFNKAIKDQSCAEFAVLDFSQTRQDTTPGAPPTGSECKFFKSALKGSKGLKFTHGTEYGTGALIEGPAPPALAKKAPGRAVALGIFVLDRDGHYRFLEDRVDLAQIGTKPSPPANDGGKNAQALIDAIRAGDCKKGVPLIHPQGSAAHSAQGNVKALCDSFVKGKITAPALRETPNPKAVRLGATRDYQFYGVATKKTYFTLIMVTPPGTSNKPPLLYDILASTDNPNIPKVQK
jgi:hypothetical protein